jgi:hypothetical protein
METYSCHEAQRHRLRRVFGLVVGAVEMSLSCGSAGQSDRRPDFDCPVQGQGKRLQVRGTRLKCLR